MGSRVWSLFEGGISCCRGRGGGVRVGVVRLCLGIEEVRVDLLVMIKVCGWII